MSKSISIRKTLFAGVAALGIGAVPMASWAETLGDALASAYKNSGLLEQNRATLRATDEGVSQAMAALRPSLSYSYSGGKTIYDADTYGEWSNTLSLVASADLYTFGRNKLAVDVQKEFVLATRAALVNVEQTVLADAVDAYMGVREAQAVLNLRQSAVRLNLQNLRAAQDRFEVGEITRTEVSQYEAQLASTRAELAAAQGELAAARETYKVAIGHYPEKLSSPPNIKLPVSGVEAAVTLAKQKHPGIVALQHEVRAHDITVEVAERSILPTVGASISHSVTDTSTQAYDDNYTSLSVGVSGTIYSGGSIASQVRAAIADRDASRAELLQTTREVEQSVRTNWSLLSVYAASEEASNAYVKAQRVAYDGVKEEADLGAATTLDVLDAEQDLLDAQVSAIQARIARETQAFSVLQSMGLLTVDQLKLNVPVYDPSAYYNAVKNAPTTYVSPQGEKLDRVLKGLMKD